MLVKDACNPVADNEYPFSRCFDWYHGHSWAHGVTAVADGKDQESTSEEAMFAYAIKMWGKVSEDPSMEARGNLMLSIVARTFRNYFLMESTNVNQPREFIDNKVTGIVSLPISKPPNEHHPALWLPAVLCAMLTISPALREQMRPHYLVLRSQEAESACHSGNPHGPNHSEFNLYPKQDLCRGRMGCLLR